MEYFYVNTIFGVFVKVVFVRNSAYDENEQMALREDQERFLRVIAVRELCEIEQYLFLSSNINKDVSSYDQVKSIYFFAR